MYKFEKFENLLSNAKWNAERGVRRSALAERGAKSGTPERARNAVNSRNAAVETLSTGLRAADVERLQYRGPGSSRHIYDFFLPFTKNGSRMIIVQLNTADSELQEPNISQKLQEHYRLPQGRGPGYPWSRLRRLSPFRLHSLRSRRAIHLVQNGYKCEEVKEKLLWRDTRSLQRYLRLNEAAILGEASVDDAILVLRSYL